MQLMYNISLPVTCISAMITTLSLFRFLDSLILDKKRNRHRFLRISMGLLNGVISAYALSFYNGGVPTVLLVFFLDILYLAEYELIGKDNQGTYYFLWSVVFFNNLIVYMMSYSIYRILPLDIFDVAGELYQRLTFVITNIGCISLFNVFKIRSFPTEEIREIVHTKDSRFLKVWLPGISGILALYSVIMLPMVQTEAMDRSIEISMYAAVFLWALSSMISSWSIILYQAGRVRVRNTLQGQLGVEQAQKAELQEQKAELQEQADRQPLTGLLNHRAWEREIKKVLAAGKNGYLIMFDLDHFKDVNDNLGHMEGDRILKETADMLRHTFRKIDIIGHIGGDEFCVFIVGDFENKIVNQRLEYLVKLRRKEFQSKSGGTFCLSLSAGYAETPKHGEVVDKFTELVAAADAALYWQKEHGRDGFVMYRKDMGLKI